MGYNPNYYSVYQLIFHSEMEFEKRYTEELQHFGKHIRQLRKSKNLTQVDLELNCKINNGDISRIENGKKNLEFYTIVKLAEGLGVALFELFDPKKLS
ncbi:MAG: helix-turn-helix domain-containing protein [Flavisolibacter sp.]